MEYVSFGLQNGFIGNWLVAGPVAALVASSVDSWVEETGISGEPVERGPLGTGEFNVGNELGVWSYVACPADHCVDHSGTYPRRQYLRSWAYAELVSDTQRAVDLALSTCGQAGVWLENKAVFQTQNAGTHAFRIQLHNEVTPVLVRFERPAQGNTPHAMSLRLEEADGIHVRIPTLIEDVGRRNAFERLTSGAYLERDVYEGVVPIVLRWPDGSRAFCPAHARLLGADDSIYALADAAGESGEAKNLGFAMQLPAGPFRVTLIPSPDEVYLKNLRIAVHIPLWSMGRERYAAVAAEATDLPTRRAEALRAIAQHADSAFAQIARMALGAWDHIETKPLLLATEAVRRAEEGSSVVLVALLGMLHRWGEHARFPWQLQQPLEDAILHHGYASETSETSESGRILAHTAESLAGQRYPDRAFGDGRSGGWHRAHGERQALEWMALLASNGSAEWGAPDAMARELVALSHLTDLADDPHVYEMAAVCTDKLLFALALNSRQGVLGSASSDIRPGVCKSGYLQPTAGISRLLWGTGIYNHHVAGVLSLACANDYDPPAILEAIAHDAPAEIWSHERHAAPGEAPADIDTYKTPDFILSSVSSLVPGNPGQSELVWRATLGPQAVVFTNHPGSSSESDSRVPGYWAGNGCLPRVAQWKDAVIALHRLPTDDLFGFTHAYFPCAAFDEYTLGDRWAFARTGDGYLALANSQRLRMTLEGRYALRDLRAWGEHQSWLVQMGRAALDGDFATFQASVQALPVSFGVETVSWTTLRGDVLTLSWSGAFLVNAEIRSTPEAKHFDNPYTTTELPCTRMEIRHGPDALRLDFGG